MKRPVARRSAPPGESIDFPLRCVEPIHGDEKTVADALRDRRVMGKRLAGFYGLAHRPTRRHALDEGVLDLYHGVGTGVGRPTPRGHRSERRQQGA
jgi:hypothetical protein